MTTKKTRNRSNITMLKVLWEWRKTTNKNKNKQKILCGFWLIVYASYKFLIVSIGTIIERPVFIICSDNFSNGLYTNNHYYKTSWSLSLMRSYSLFLSFILSFFSVLFLHSSQIIDCWASCHCFQLYAFDRYTRTKPFRANIIELLCSSWGAFYGLWILISSRRKTWI